MKTLITAFAWENLWLWALSVIKQAKFSDIFVEMKKWMLQTMKRVLKNEKTSRFKQLTDKEIDLLHKSLP